MKRNWFYSILVLVLCLSIVTISEAGSNSKKIAKLIKKLEKSRDPDVRSQAARDLGKMGSQEAVPPLANALKDKEEKVRVSAARALWDLEDLAKSAQEALREALKDPSPTVKYNTVGALSALGEDRKNLVQARKEIFQNGSLFERFYSGRAIRDEIGDDAMMEVTLAAVEQYEWSSDLGGAARDMARDLVKTQNRKLIPAMMYKLKSGNVDVRSFVAENIGNFKPAATEAIPVLRKMLTERNNDIQTGSARGLGNMKADAYEATADIAQVLLNCSDKYLCQAAARALGYIGDSTQKNKLHLDSIAKEAVPALETVLTRNVDVEIRTVCAEAIGDIGPRAINALPTLITLLEQDPNPKIREAACEGIQGMGPAAKSAIPALKKAEEDSNSFVKNAAWRALLRVERK